MYIHIYVYHSINRDQIYDKLVKFMLNFYADPFRDNQHSAEFLVIAVVLLPNCSQRISTCFSPAMQIYANRVKQREQIGG